MAEIQPLSALRYDLDRTGGLQDVVAPPVRRDRRRAARAAGGALAVQRRAHRPPEGRGPLRARRRALLAEWRASGVRRRATSEPALWALAQDYTGPDGRQRTRRGFFARVRVEEYGAGRIRPHERTHPGPEEDRLRLTRATRANLSPIFSPVLRPGSARGAARWPATSIAPRGRRRPTTTGPSTACGASPTRPRSRPSQAALADSRAADRRRPSPL